MQALATCAFEMQNSIHLAGARTADYLDMKALPAWQPYSAEEPAVDLYGLAMNCELPPFDNVHIRRAVAFAINRPRWKRARANRILTTGQPIPALLPGYDAALPERQRFDVGRAKEEMRLAGHPNGLHEPVDMWLGQSPGAQSTGELVQADLKAIGIEVNLKPVAFPVYLEETGKRRTVQMFTTGWLMDFPDPSNFLDVLFHSRSIRNRNSENRAFYSNLELDTILDAARIEIDADKRIGLYRKANAIVARDAPWAFLYSSLNYEAWQPYVKGYEPHPVWDRMFRDVWLDLPRQRLAASGRAQVPVANMLAARVAH